MNFTLQDLTVVVAVTVAMISSYALGETMAAGSVIGRQFMAVLYPTGLFEAAARALPYYLTFLSSGFIALLFYAMLAHINRATARWILVGIIGVALSILVGAIEYRLSPNITQTALIFLHAPIMVLLLLNDDPRFIGIIGPMLIGIAFMSGICMGRDAVASTIQKQQPSVIEIEGRTYDDAVVIRTNSTGVLFQYQSKFVFHPMDKIFSIVRDVPE
jgi:hypothetical protein